MTFGLLETVILNRAPKFMRGPNIGRFLKAYAATLDGVHEKLRQGLTFSNPLICPRSCFPHIAKDRALKLYASEPEIGTRRRLSRWLQLHQQRGMHQGVMRHARERFADGNYPLIRIVHQDGNGNAATWHSLAPDGKYTSTKSIPSNFNYDDRPSLWSRWWVFVYMDGTGYTPPNTYDDGHVYDDGEVYDGGGARPFPVEDWPDLVAMFYDWKRCGTWLAGVALVWNTADIDPLGTPTQTADGWWTLPNGFGTWGEIVNPGTGIATRPPNVQFIYDNPSPP